ncbi:cation transporter [Moraxella nasovis]|uniref:cation transporter n=1 Tax=Moraxella nasovis TaxID=2904121 RepID=UPI001F60C53B|nr:cation transporter [Moraxella nasovis]UNU73838.1 cation transporter [Moraxella nasovis]
MSCQCSTQNNAVHSDRYRNILWIVLILNFSMFFVEVFIGWRSGSVSLLADSLDFLGDSANYLITLFVLGKTLQTRAKASLIKGISMGLMGLWILFTTLYNLFMGDVPNYHDMGVVGLLALAVNVTAAWLLYHFREGDSNMQSVWLCSRNDAIGNVMVVLAAVAVYFSQSKIPDLLVAGIMVYLSLSASKAIISRAWSELKEH